MPTTDPHEIASNAPVASNGQARTQQRGLLGAVALVILHFMFVMTLFAPAISTPDANGYFAQARHLATEGHTWFEAGSPLQYIPPHWLSEDGKRYYSKYPPGLPLIAAGAWQLGGPIAALLVNPAMASLTVLGVFLLCRLWIGARWALLVALLVAINPITNAQALWAFAHTAVAMFVVWGVYALAQWERHHGWAYAFLAGFCFGVLPTIRYAEALMCLAMFVFVVANLNMSMRCVRSVLAGVVGVSIPILALCIRNHFAFGAFWKTGYAMTNEQTGFGFAYFVEHALPYLQQLLAEGAGMTFGVGVIGLAALCASRDTRTYGVLLTLLALPTTLLYMAYYFPPDGASMRFLVPTLFVYPIASVWLLKILAEHRRSSAHAALAVLVAVSLVWGVPVGAMRMSRHHHTNGALATTVRALHEHVAPGGIVLGDQLVLQNLDFVGGWRLADASILQRGRRRPPRPRADDHGSPTPMYEAGESRRRARYEALRGPDLVGIFVDDVWTFADGADTVYWFAAEEDVERIKRRLTGFGTIERLQVLEFPGGPAQDQRGPAGPGQREPGRRPGPGGRGQRGGPPGQGQGGPMGNLPETLVLLQWHK